MRPTYHPIHETLRTTLIAALLAAMALSLQPIQPAQAATIGVTVTNDELDGTCAGATVATVGGAADVSLREAICIANSAGGPDVITLGSNTYALSGPGTAENGNVDGDLDIAGDLTINGNGPGTTVVDASGLTNRERVFQILSGTVNFNDLTVTGGLEQGADGPPMNGGGTALGGSGITATGGGIFNSGTLTLDNVSVESNRVIGGNGGNGTNGTSQSLGGLAGAAHGGGIYNTGTLTLQNGSQVTNNDADGGDGGDASGAPDFNQGGNASGALGGGIFSNGTLTLDNSSVDVNGNINGGQGGDASDGDITTGGNGGVGYGAGIYASGPVTLQNGSSVSENTGYGGDGGNASNGSAASLVGGGTGGNARGAGIWSGSPLVVDGSSVSDNWLTGGDGGDASGSGALCAGGNAGWGLGGGVYSGGQASVQSASSVSDNTALGGDGGSAGGCTVFNVAGSNGEGQGGGAHSNGSLTVDRSYFTYNQAQTQGAALNNGIFADPLTVTFSSLNNNDALDEDGGAIYVATSSLTAQCNDITGNTAGGTGEGVFNETAEDADARFNWWGAADGPSDGGGTSATGSGQSIATNGGAIDFSGFLTNFADLATCVVPTPPSGGGGGDDGVIPPVVAAEGTIKSVDREVAGVGDTLTYTILWPNPKDVTATEAVFEDVFDGRLDNLSVVSTSHGTASVTGNTVRVDGFELKADETLKVVIRATISDRAGTGDVIGNTATLTSPDLSTHTSNTVHTTIVGELPVTGYEPVGSSHNWLVPALLAGGLLALLGWRLRRRLAA